MRAIVVNSPGGPERMELVDFEPPMLGEGEALVAVEAAGVNFIDIYHRSGVYPLAMPARIGREGAGVVVAVGPGAPHIREGERVAWCDVTGSYATHVVAPVSKLVPVPSEVDARTAAGVMLQGLTAHYLTRGVYALEPGDTCLVHSAAGGVGLLLCQFAKACGAHAIGVVSTPEKAALAKAHGADDVLVVKSGAPFSTEVLARTEGKGVDVVYDGVGRDTWEESLRSVRARGMLVLYGQSSGLIPPIDPLLLMQRGSVFLTRPSLYHYTATRSELLERARDVFYAVAREGLRVTIGGEFPLADAAEAHRRLASRSTTGKLLLIP